MDPLSITASVAAVATVAFQIIQFLGTITAGGKDRLSLLTEITGLWLSISALQAQIAPDGIPDPSKLGQQGLLPLFEQEGIFKAIELQVRDLNETLKKKTTHGKIRQTLAWPFNQADVLQVVERLHRMQQTLQFALTQSNHALTQDIYKDGKAVKNAVDETKFKEMLDWLSSLNFVAKQNMLFKEHHEGTCKWFLESDGFRRWKTGEISVMFCPGIPGAGKTLLSSIVINELTELQRSEESMQNTAILMLFCKWDDPLCQSIDALIASILRQVAQTYGVKGDGMMDMFSKHNKAGTRPNREELTSQLGKELDRFDRTFIIVDGCDEVRDEKSRMTLLEILTSFSAKINIMVTSRPLNTIVRHFTDLESEIICDGCAQNNFRYQYHCMDCSEDVPGGVDFCQSCFDQGKRCGRKGHIFCKQYNGFKIDIAAVEEDLLTYVQWRVNSSDFLQHCVEMKEGLLTDIVNTVVKKNDGMFLLAKFNMDTLASKLRPGDVVKALQSLPRELDGTYNDAMLRINELPASHKDVVMDFLGWVVFAERPLESREIEHAIAVAEDDRDINEDNIIRAEVLASMCAGLVVFDEVDCVRLVHYSAENFFSRHRETWFSGSNSRLASVCLTYLLFDEFRDGSCSGPNESADFDARVEGYPFLRYAATCWGKHLLQASNEDLYVRARTLLTSPGYLRASTQALWYLDDHDSASWAGKDGSSALHLATHFNLDKLVAELLRQGEDPNVRDANGATPLALAASRGAIDVASTLIQAGAWVNARDNIGGAPLHQAASQNQVEMVALLLKQKDIDPNIAHPRWFQYTPLLEAISGEFTDVIRTLLSASHIQVNQECTYPRGATALSLAARLANPEPVQLLLAHPGIDINHQDHSGTTALISATTNGRFDVVRALIEKGADTEVKEKDAEGTALLRAIDYDRIPIVEYLLQHGANVHHKDSLGRGMLHGAAVNGRTEILRILLKWDNGLDVNAQDIDGKTTLHDAARFGHYETLQLLLEYGGDPTIRDNAGRTPIRVAREMNQKSVLDLLRTARKAKNKEVNGASIGIPPRRTDTGTILQSPQRTDTEISVDTPLSLWGLAAQGLTEEIEDQLSKGDEDINLTDADMGQTALHFASFEGHVSTVRLLISHGADVDIANRYGRRPLHLAAICGVHEIAEMLLEAGAEIDAKDHWGDTPMLIAAANDWDICVLLVERGADLSDRRLNLDRLLEMSGMEGNEVAVRRLVAAGAQVWRKNVFGQTPHMVAKACGHDDIAKLILELAQSVSVASLSRSGSENIDRDERDDTDNGVVGSSESSTLSINLDREKVEGKDN